VVLDLPLGGEARGIAAVIDLVAAHRAIGAALGGSDVEEDESDLGEVEESAAELQLAGGMGAR
jgi:hypothetical protein